MSCTQSNKSGVTVTNVVPSQLMEKLLELGVCSYRTTQKVYQPLIFHLTDL